MSPAPGQGALSDLGQDVELRITLARKGKGTAPHRCLTALPPSPVKVRIAI